MNRTTFTIEDEAHSESHGDFSSFADAVAELDRRAAIAWDQEPNAAPCTNWQNCGRRYEIVEYDDMTKPRTEVRRVPALEISANGVRWRIARSEVRGGNQAPNTS